MSSFGTMNRLEIPDDDTLSFQSTIPPQWQTTITTVALLLLAYYGWPYLAYETTIKRRLYEFAVWMVPMQFIQALEKGAARIAGLPKPTPSENAHDQSGNTALNQLYEGSGVSSVVQRARRLSGFDKLVQKSVEISYPGLGNWDNSCFQNSVLQGLASLQAFRAFIDKSSYMDLLAGIEAPTHEALKIFLGQLQREISGRNTIWPPSVLRSMNTWQQQDAQEYFSKIMDAIEKEAIKYQNTISKRLAPSLGCLRLKNSDTEASQQEPDRNTSTQELSELMSALPPSNPLDGSLSQSLRCQRCGYSEGLSLIPFNCLTLNLGLGGDSYLEDLLDVYTDPELIEGVECDECTRLASDEAASEKTESEQLVSVPVSAMKDHKPNDQTKKHKVLSTKAKQVLFGRLPRNLVFHINRSIFDEWGNQRKNISHIRFPATLNIGEEWMESPFTDTESEVYAVYELRCIVTHQGRHDNGHYVACGKRGKEWYSFNDEMVTRISEEQVLARGHVFMLFYEQVDHKPVFEEPSPSTSSSEDVSQNTDNLDRPTVDALVENDPSAQRAEAA